MQVFRKIKKNLLYSSSLALGFFDGVHLGHQKVINNAIEKAKYTSSAATVVTFANHPIELLWNVKPEFITTLDERLKLFEKQGIEAVLVLDFTDNIAHKSAKDYLREIIIETLNPKHITVGFNHHFGADKSGDEKFLQDESSFYGYDVSVISPVTLNDDTVSSTLIRTLIKQGKTYEASLLLGRMYSIKNRIVHGEKRGQQMGYPTANLALPENKIVPSYGVYSGLVNYKGSFYKSVINVGKRPTFADLEQPLAEVHILDFDKEIYGENLQVSFYQKIRDEKKFDNIEGLKQQIKTDYQVVQNMNIDNFNIG